MWVHWLHDVSLAVRLLRCTHLWRALQMDCSQWRLHCQGINPHFDSISWCQDFGPFNPQNSGICSNIHIIVVYSGPLLCLKYPTPGKLMFSSNSLSICFGLLERLHRHCPWHETLLVPSTRNHRQRRMHQLPLHNMRRVTWVSENVIYP